MRWLLYAASGLVFLAGFQLFILTEYTDKYFAWTINPPITAAFLGGSYWASVAVELIAARERFWARARIAIPAVWLFTTLTLIVTLIHIDKFHFNSPDLIPRFAAWFWLAIYAGVPIAMLLVLITQRRLQGGDPPRELPFPIWLRIILPAQGAIMLIVGASLFASTSTTISIWPWKLTLLTGRAIGAWLLAVGVAAFHAMWENDLYRIRPLGGGFAVIGVLEIVALLRYPQSLDWTLTQTWVYLIIILTVLVVGVYALIRSRATNSIA
jgi:hypothetical protein